MKKVLLYVVLALGVALGGGLWWAYGHLGALVKRGVETVGPRVTGTEVSLGTATLSIFSGEGALHRLHIGNPKGFTTDDAFDLGKVSVSIDPRSVAGKVVHVRSVVVEAPELTGEFDAVGGSNLKAILDHARSGGSKSSGGGGGGSDKKLIIDEFRFENAQLRVLAPAYQVDEVLKLPPIVLKNLGAKQGGAAAADIAEQVLVPVLNAAAQAAAQRVLEARAGKAKDQLLNKIFK